MAKVLNAFGKVITTFTNLNQDLVVGIIIYVLVAYMVMFYFNGKSINNIFISELIDKDFKKTRKHVDRNKKKADENSLKLLMSYGYSGFVGIFTFIFKCLLGGFMAFSLNYEGASTIDPICFDTDLSMSIKDLSASGEYKMPLVIIVAVVAIFLQLLHDGYVERKVILGTAAVDLGMIIVLTVFLIYFPSAFVLFYAVYTLVETIMLYYQTTIQHDGGMKRLEKSLQYTKSSFDRRYEAQINSLNKKDKKK